MSDYKKKYLKYKNKYLELKNQIGGSNDFVDEIKNIVKELFNSIDIDIILYNIRSYISDSDNNTNIIGLNFPIYHLFDHKIYDDIGSSLNNLDILIDHFNLNELFTLDKDNIYEIIYSSHATILYKFKYNDNYYIYYSNSGLGIDNQITDINKNLTACKIYKINNIELWNTICIDIELIYSSVIYFSKQSDFSSDYSNN